MRDYTVTEQFALVGLNGQDSRHNTTAKKIVLKGIAVAEVLERLLERDLSGNQEDISGYLNREIQEIRKMKRNERDKIERDITGRLTLECVLTETPNLLGCDINYYTADVSMWVYRSAESVYQRIIECVRAEALEEGEMSIETICLLYLFRECSCIHDIFSVKEQDFLQEKLLSCMAKDNFCRAFLSIEFRGADNLYVGFLKRKHEIFRNPYLQGVNLLFPFLERRQAIFIDMVVLGTDVSQRREAVMDFLREKGHLVKAVSFGEEYLLKIDNCYYRIFPMTRVYKLPVQGVSLIPVYQ